MILSRYFAIIFEKPRGSIIQCRNSGGNWHFKATTRRVLLINVRELANAAELVVMRCRWRKRSTRSCLFRSRPRLTGALYERQIITGLLNIHQDELMKRRSICKFP